MKKRASIPCLILIFSTILIVGIAAKKKDKFDFYVPTSDELITGTWVNMEYGVSNHPQKVVCYHWGSYDIFMRATDTNPSYKGANTIVAKWVDKEGNTWTKMYWRENWTTTVHFELDRFSKNGTVYELCYDPFDFPTEDDVKSKNLAKNYKIFFRQ